ncbi:MAG: hypothetical protein HOP97_08475, partial [Terrabacter sp.]|nr:hypothetical protein [Terrabacter sp.]
MVVFTVMKPHQRHLRSPLALLTLGAVLATAACGQATPSGGSVTPAGDGGTASSSPTSGGTAGG